MFRIALCEKDIGMIQKDVCLWCLSSIWFIYCANLKVARLQAELWVCRENK